MQNMCTRVVLLWKVRRRRHTSCSHFLPNFLFVLQEQYRFIVSATVVMLERLLESGHTQRTPSRFKVGNTHTQAQTGCRRPTPVCVCV